MINCENKTVEAKQFTEADKNVLIKCRQEKVKWRKIKEMEDIEVTSEDLLRLLIDNGISINGEISKKINDKQKLKDEIEDLGGG